MMVQIVWKSSQYFFIIEGNIGQFLVNFDQVEIELFKG